MQKIFSLGFLTALFAFNMQCAETRLGVTTPVSAAAMSSISPELLEQVRSSRNILRSTEELSKETPLQGTNKEDDGLTPIQSLPSKRERDGFEDGRITPFFVAQPKIK